MAKYLITGGCGFIGSHLAEELINRGYDVHILDDLSTGKKENAPIGATLFIGSVTDPAIMKKSLEGVKTVFHLAAIASVQKSITYWSNVHQINSGGCVHLYEILAKSKCPIPVIYASSSCIYGDGSGSSSQENDPTNPLSPYGIDKLAGEWHAKVLWNLFQVPSVSFRFFNVYGPRQDPTSPYSGVISIFAKCILEKAPLIIYGDGQQVRDFIYVKDVVHMMIEAALCPLKGAKVYNLCSGQGTSINQLVDIMEKVAGRPVDKKYMARREGEIHSSIGDPTKLKVALQLQTNYSLKEGLSELMVTCV